MLDIFKNGRSPIVKTFFVKGQIIAGGAGKTDIETAFPDTLYHLINQYNGEIIAKCKESIIE